MPKFFLRSELVVEACFVSRNRCVKKLVGENFLPVPGIEPMSCDDPLHVGRQRGNATVRLVDSIKIYIDKGEKDLVLRWFQKPTMIRKLFFILVGPDHLKNMSAKGRLKGKRKGRPRIPKDIYRAVECKIIISVYEFLKILIRHLKV